MLLGLNICMMFIGFWKCIKGSPWQGILYACYGYLNANVFIDAYWEGSKLDKRSTAEYCWLAAILCLAKEIVCCCLVQVIKLNIRQITHRAGDLLWLRIVLKELGFTKGGPMILGCVTQPPFILPPIQYARSFFFFFFLNGIPWAYKTYGSGFSLYSREGHKERNSIGKSIHWRASTKFFYKSSC